MCDRIEDKVHVKFYDLLEKVEKEGKSRKCPKCGGEDCKYGTHSKVIRGFDLSIVCNDCGYGERANNPNYERIINNWYVQGLVSLKNN